MKTYRITQIVTHKRAHLDEIASIIALQDHGSTKYLGIATARIVNWDPAIHDDGRSEEEWLAEGVLFIGVRGGRFDDHPHDDHPRDCAFSRVITDIGLDRYHPWNWLAEQIFKEDRHGASDVLHLAATVKALARVHTSEEIVDIVRPILSALLSVQISFEEAVEIIEKDGEIIRVMNEKHQRELVGVVIRSTNEDVSAAARWIHGVNAAMVLHFTPRSNGQRDMVHISIAKRTLFTSLRWLAANLRKREAEWDPTLQRVSDFDSLAKDGSLHRWYHQRGAKAIYSGSLTHPDGPTSILSGDVIRDLMVEFLSTCQLVEKNGTAQG